MTDHLYAVIDPAKNSEIWPALTRFIPDPECLFSGVTEDALRQVSPHLISVSYNHDFLAWWRNNGHGKAWGFVFEAHDNADTVRRHLKKFMFAYLPDDHRVIFRFWDPVILTAHLEKCSPEGKQAFFRGMTKLYAEHWKTGLSVTIPLPAQPDLQARSSGFTHLNPQEYEHLTKVYIFVRVYNLLTEKTCSDTLKDTLLKYREELIMFWAGLWLDLNFLPLPVLAPALAFVTVIRLQNKNVKTELRKILDNDDPDYVMSSYLADHGYFPFTAFNETGLS